LANNYDIFLDGQRLLMIRNSVSESPPTQINEVLNWFDEPSPCHGGENEMTLAAGITRRDKCHKGLVSDLGS